ncbi:HAMP domain-containing protein [Cohnella sp. CFH 77786]|uniref:sensor histidine kinase n=1 Tax=Cohnella sp. CFH 77786 TaxID=2662265 RepID=UPI001C60A752|nr:sensor histidine kinase [Cohnella sp. CFH 77786]MBW5444447.1 HAMP domain-containing protein [Cohnella sp. CFH 77786]
MRWIAASLQRKLSLLMLVSTLLPLSLLGVFTYAMSTDITEQKLEQSSIDTMGQMQRKLRFVISDVESLSILLTGQSDIQLYLSTTAVSEQAKTRILSFMGDLISSKNYISNITIYPRRFNPVLSTTNIYESTLGEQVDIAQVKEKRWTGLYDITNYAGKHRVISLIRPMRSIYTFEDIGWLVISLEESAIAEFWKEPRFGEGKGQVLLFDEGGSILSSTERSWLSRNVHEVFPGLTRPAITGKYALFHYGQNAERKDGILYPEPTTGWTLAGLAPDDLKRTQNTYILQLTAAAVVISILMNTGLILFVIQRVTNPLKVLSRLLSKINPDEPMPLYHPSSHDEIGQLSESYNKLGRHIKQLKEQLIRNETRKKEADIRALQAQINPHFLYNTLSSVHWMALMSDEKRIAEMVGALSDFLQFSLNKGRDYCPVRQELAHIHNYTQIQALRFPDQFEVEYIIDPELSDKYMLKLLLQPLLENAMIHGIQKKTGKGTIAIYLERRGNDMQFLILDDGAGMSDERLEQIRDSLRSPDPAGIDGGASGYGLRNVNERLRLHYGPQSCLQIDSRPNAGTRISFSIPILEGPE